METSSHKKHADLARPALGHFARNEWAILGTPCGNIQKLAKHLIEALSFPSYRDKTWKIAYADADHQAAPAHDFNRGAQVDYTDKVDFHRLDIREKLDSFQFRPLFNGVDAVIVNGNHFPAKAQVVVIDPKKEDSLRRKLDRLTDVQLILTTPEAPEPWQFLKENLKDFEKIPILQFADFQGIAEFFQKKLAAAVPPLHGLVLAGGKSQRMGQDKGLLHYHSKPQREFMLDLLSGFCEKTWLSCRQEQAPSLEAAGLPALPDTFDGLGPFGAILSAFRAHPNAAWLVVACDLPLLDEAALRFLMGNRNPSAIATAFRSSEEHGFPEPLVAIWEPRSYLVLLQFLAQGYSCPRKALLNSPVHLLDAPDPLWLQNVNTPEELDRAMGLLKK